MDKYDGYSSDALFDGIMIKSRSKTLPDGRISFKCNINYIEDKEIYTITSPAPHRVLKLEFPLATLVDIDDHAGYLST